MIIRNSAKAITIYENQLLVAKLFDEEDGVYYLLPGGGQEPKETLERTVIRECFEETGMNVVVHELLFVRECFMQQDIHRVEFMFYCTLADESSAHQPKLLEHMDDRQTGTAWIPIDQLSDAPLYPSTLRSYIQAFHRKERLPIYVGEIK